MPPLLRHCLPLAAALLCCLPAATAAAQGGPLGGTAPEPDPLPTSQAAPPQAVALTALAPRAAASSAAWDPVRNSYARAYVTPASWKLKLDGCGSRGGANDSGARASIRAYRWSIEPLEGQRATPLTAASASCVTDTPLPKLGRWRVRLTVEDSRGAAGATSQIVTLRDKLIVALGDSSASGEGNPESQNDLPDWIDEQCHRSDSAWPARVARSLENRSTAVTFVSFACSGAEIRHLTETGYAGAEPAEQLPAQLVAARQLLGDPLNSGTRQADVVLLAAGVNDLHIGEILTDCALTIIGSCEVSLAREHAALPESYDELEAAISANLRAASTVIAQYPARLFTNGSDEYETCGAFGIMSEADARWITDEANQLNRTLGDAAARHDWTPVAVTDAFRGHGYCADDTWFRLWGESLATQEDDRGTAHPNGAGHRAVAELVTPRVNLDAVAPPVQRLEVRFLRARVVDDAIRDPAEPGPLDPHVDFTVLWQRSACGHAIETLRGFGIAGQWRDLDTDPCLRFPLSTVGRSIETRIHTAAGGSLNVQAAHRRGAGWDAVSPLDPGGVRRLRLVQPKGILEVEYRVTIAPVNA
jgi:lysophospholipase L1-like esterase